MTTATCCQHITYDVIGWSPFLTLPFLDETEPAGFIEFQRWVPDPSDSTQTVQRCGMEHEFSFNHIHFHPNLLERFVAEPTAGQFSQSEFSSFDFRKFPWGNYCAIKIDGSFYDSMSDFLVDYNTNNGEYASCEIKESCLHAADLMTQYMVDTNVHGIDGKNGKNCWAVGPDGKEVSVNLFDKNYANQWVNKPAPEGQTSATSGFLPWCPTGEPASDDCMFADSEYAQTTGLTNHLIGGHPLTGSYFPDLNLFTGIPDENADGHSDANPDNTACLGDYAWLQGAPLFCEMSVKDFNTEGGFDAAYSGANPPLLNDKYVSMVGMLSSSAGCNESGAMNMYVQTYFANDWIYEISNSKAGKISLLKLY